MPSTHLILCRPLLLLPSIFPSIRVFSSESALCIRWPKYWSFSFRVLSFFYGPTLTSIHDCQKNHNFDYRDHCHIKFNCGWFFSLWYFLNFLWTSLFLSLAYNYPHLWLGHILCWEDREEGKAMDLYRLLWSQFHLIQMTHNPWRSYTSSFPLPGILAAANVTASRLLGLEDEYIFKREENWGGGSPILSL